jgi:hypothetical protein
METRAKSRGVFNTISQAGWVEAFLAASDLSVVFIPEDPVCISAFEVVGDDVIVAIGFCGVARHLVHGIARKARLELTSGTAEADVI